jgi:ribosomal protein S18 acetylase RimI-like enzyme
MTEDYHVERLQKQDWQRLKSLRMRSVSDAPAAFGTSLESMKARKDQFWSAQAEQMACFVVCRLAQEGKEDLGLVRGARDPESIEHVWLLGMWVDPVTRGHGLGLRLGQAVLEWARAIDEVCVVKLEVANDNRPAIDLYERIGFKATAQGQRDSGKQPKNLVYQYLF